MKTEFTTEEIIKNKGCFNQKRIKTLLFKHALDNLHNIVLKPYIFVIDISKLEEIKFLSQGFSVNMNSILKSTDITLLDKRWFVSTTCELELKEKKKLFLEVLKIAMPLWQNKLSIFLNENKNKLENPYEIYNITTFAKAMEYSLKDMYDSALRDIVYFIISCGEKFHSDKILETYIKFFNR